VCSGANIFRFDGRTWRTVFSDRTYQVYRQTVRGPVSHADVLRFLLTDTRFPRSIGFCLAQMDTLLRRLPRSSTISRDIQKLVDELEHVDFDRLDRQALHRYTDELQVGFGRLHDRIAATYFLNGPATTTGAPAT